MPKVILDTNVLVSALFWSGAEAAVVELVESGILEGYTSPAIIDELTRVLRYPRFGLTKEEVENASDYYKTIFVVVRPEARIDAIREDPDDNRLLECALEARADLIVTGDRHLLKICSYGGTRIVRASEFLKTQGFADWSERK